MQEHSVCPSCMGSLSEWYPLFVLFRTDLVKKITGDINVNVTEYVENNEINMSEVFDMMGITQICCRGHLTAAKDFYDYYRAT